ncbi:DinB family protein [uncultured Aquimarina sp.]|uniref:DinB family protein n=1 Tax=uncultured Aquimarina sp. TaxID=575652 RepID=UPI0026291000|nr:DinB family protein [uncultured Aquimarina sp.]
MTKSELIANRLREVLLNGTWIANTNYKQQIESMTWQQANQKIETLNTIAILTYHINYYLGGILNVFIGGKLEIKDKFSFDMPPVTSETDWKNLISEFLTNAEEFILQIEKMDDQKLDEIFIDQKYGTYLRNIEGFIEHSYYHLGQISLIKKLITENNE